MTDEGKLLLLVAFAITYVFLFLGVSKNRRHWFFDRPENPKKQFHRSRLLSVLLDLDDDSFAELMKLYRAEFGAGPAYYARRTYKKWKTGKVMPNVETYERFLQHLPKVMTYDMKCDVLRLFVEEFAGKDNYELDVYPDDWEEKLAPLVNQVVNKAFTAKLPIQIERKLRWLVEGDMQAAQNILRASQAEEGRIMTSMLQKDFDAINRLVSVEHLNPKVTHVLKFPYGTISLNVRKRPN